jgi:hypothetical protein
MNQEFEYKGYDVVYVIGEGYYAQYPGSDEELVGRTIEEIEAAIDVETTEQS